MTSMHKRRILIVDNNDELRTMLERALGALGHEVLTTGNRAEAMARDDLDGFDLIISDLTEDAESNLEPLSALQRKHLVTPIAQNGGSTAGIIKAFKMSAANFLRQPYNRDEFTEIVEQTLANKLKFVDDPNLLLQV